MAIHKSAQKASRQTIRRTERRKAALSKCRTSIKNLRTALAATKKDPKKLTELFNETQSVLMKAKSKGILKAGTASRYVSRLNVAVQSALRA